LSITENWGKRGRVVVSRDGHGRFITWKRAVSIPPAFFFEEYGGKSVAIYGYASVDGGMKSRRYEFSGSGRDLYRALRVAHHVVPGNKNRFVRVSARQFLSRPYHYGVEGFWVEKEIES
jgi:hypothetical protein